VQFDKHIWDNQKINIYENASKMNISHENKRFRNSFPANRERILMEAGNLWIVRSNALTSKAITWKSHISTFGCLIILSNNKLGFIFICWSTFVRVYSLFTLHRSVVTVMWYVSLEVRTASLNII
jgi:hypothetical protein